MPDSRLVTAGDLRGLVRRSQRILLGIIISQGVVLVLAVAAIVGLGVALYADRQQIRTALCDSQHTIATAQLPPASATKLGVQFVEASRKAFVVLHCAGRLEPPSPELERLGHRYSVVIRY